MSRIIFFIIVLLPQFTQDHYTQERNKMIEEQILARGIKDGATINAMRQVPRHEFVPEEKAAFAYYDGPLSIGYGQTISQPYIVAYMTEILQLKNTHKVLEIGTGSGYQAAVLSNIANEVYTIEIVEPLGYKAKQRLKDLGYNNVNVRIGDGYKGWPEAAPFDAIIVTAAPEEIPKPLMDQLKENGKMIIPVGSQYHTQYLTLVEKRKGEIFSRKVLPVRFVPFTRETSD